MWVGRHYPAKSLDDTPKVEVRTRVHILPFLRKLKAAFTMGQFDDILNSLKVVLDMLAMACVGVFWAVVAGLVLATALLHDALVRLEGMRCRPVLQGAKLKGIVKDELGQCNVDLREALGERGGRR